MTLKVKVFTLSCFLVACGSPAVKPETPDPDDSVRAVYEEYRSRLPRFLEPSPWVVSRFPDRLEHTGDSLIWSGILLASLPCDDEARGYAEGLRDSLVGGVLFRHPTLPDKISLDGAIGIYRGISSQLSRCSWAKEVWQNWVAEHLTLVSDTGTLNPRAGVTLPPGFDYLLEGLAWRMDLHSKPSDTRNDAFMLQLEGWARAVAASKAACFRIHLGYQSIRTMDNLGLGPSPRERGRWCNAAEGHGLPLIDWYCGQGGLDAWVKSYRPNEWEYRHQRCGSWETPDGKTDLETPAVDLLHAVIEGYNWTPVQNLMEE